MDGLIKIAAGNFGDAETSMTPSGDADPQLAPWCQSATMCADSFFAVESVVLNESIEGQKRGLAAAVRRALGA